MQLATQQELTHSIRLYTKLSTHHPAYLIRHLASKFGAQPPAKVIARVWESEYLYKPVRPNVYSWMFMANFRYIAVDHIQSLQAEADEHYQNLQHG